jgi:hypothetical protein
VFLTPTSWARIFTKTVSDLRNKVILQFEADDIDGLRIAEGNKEFEAAKSGDDWQIRKPINTKADNTELTTFISSIRFARASSFAEPPVDTRTAGLAPPAIRITLHDSKLNSDRTLLIGKSPETDKFYAKDASRDSIFIIDKDIAEKSRRPVFDWREKSITRIVRDNIEEIEIARGADKFVIKKADTDWTLPDGKKLQWDKVSSMLNTLEFDKAVEIIDLPGTLTTYGLDRPKLEVVFRQGSNELLRLTFGADASKAEGIYIKSSDSPAVKVVSKDVFDKFNVKAEDLVETTASGSGN